MLSVYTSLVHNRLILFVVIIMMIATIMDDIDTTEWSGYDKNYDDETVQVVGTTFCAEENNSAQGQHRGTFRFGNSHRNENFEYVPSSNALEQGRGSKTKVRL